MATHESTTPLPPSFADRVAAHLAAWQPAPDRVRMPPEGWSDLRPLYMDADPFLEVMAEAYAAAAVGLRLAYAPTDDGGDPLAADPNDQGVEWLVAGGYAQAFAMMGSMATARHQMVLMQEHLESGLEFLAEALIPPETVLAIPRRQEARAQCLRVIANLSRQVRP